jgi:uncharacterized membrane protein YfcA
MSPTGIEYLLIGLAGVGGGAVNAMAGGGTLITFPTLTAVGIPPVSANVTNTVALSPGYLSGTLAQRKDLEGQRPRLARFVPTAVVGGITGGVLLLATSDEVFRRLVPFLILAASVLLAMQDRIRAAIARRLESSAAEHDALALLPVFAASIYGGYFGAGLGIILLAVLGLVLDDTLTRLNALKQALSFSINVATACLFLFSGRVSWLAALVLAAGAVTGGALGGKLAHRVDPAALRRIVVTIGVVVATVYFVR